MQRYVKLLWPLVQTGWSSSISEPTSLWHVSPQGAELSCHNNNTQLPIVLSIHSLSALLYIKRTQYTWAGPSPGRSIHSQLIKDDIQMTMMTAANTSQIMSVTLALNPTCWTSCARTTWLRSLRFRKSTRASQLKKYAVRRDVLKTKPFCFSSSLFISSVSFSVLQNCHHHAH